MTVPALAIATQFTLDPGIRRTVMWLRSCGFETTDSGDGVSKSPVGDDGELDFPHVFMTCDPFDMVAEARRLLGLLTGLGLDFGRVEASFSPNDGIAVIALTGVLDEHFHGTSVPLAGTDTKEQEPK